MQITIKITFNQLTYLNDCFAEMEKPKNFDRASRIAENILQNLHKKLLKKTISKIGCSSGSFKLTLEYYEAHFLEQYLLHNINFVSKYTRPYTAIQMIIDDLNQKLA